MRYEQEGSAGMADRSSRPHRLHNPTDPLVVGEILVLRRQRLCGRHIALKTQVSPAEPVVRYEHALHRRAPYLTGSDPCDHGGRK